MLWIGYWAAWQRGLRRTGAFLGALRGGDIGAWVTTVVTGAALLWIAGVVIVHLLADPGTGPLGWQTQLRQWIPYALVPIGLALGVQFLLTALRNLTSREIYRSFTQKEQYGDANPDEP